MKINKGRIAVLIGKNGEMKLTIEQKLGIKIDLNSKTGDCNIRADFKNPNYNFINILTAEKVVEAINRGFNPTKAMKLLGEEYDLDTINLLQFLGMSDKKLKRIKGRIIGRGGEMRKALEKYTESYVSVYVKTVSIIANYENLLLARKVIKKLIRGMPHHSVLRFLETKYNEKKKEEFRQLYKPEF